VADGVFVDNAGQGLYRVKLLAADTSGVESSVRLFYDVQLKESVGTFTVDKGTLLVQADVTRAA
jgi:hypothetical protein